MASLYSGSASPSLPCDDEKQVHGLAARQQTQRGSTTRKRDSAGIQKSTNLSLQQLREVVERKGDLGMLVAEHLLLDRERLLEQRRGLGQLALRQ